MTSNLKPVEFRGRSLKELRDFPKAARTAAGHQIDQVQRGLEPDDWRPMKTVGKGVREIRISEANGLFRVIYVANMGSKVYVLRCFQKKTLATSKTDIETAKERYSTLRNELGA